jgi:hypothetical protein
VTGDFIDFISSYCDRWCERCAYTSRCVVFATQAAIAMCGDVREGIELVVGMPRDPEDVPEPAAVPDWFAGIGNDEPTAAELAEVHQELGERTARVGRSSMMNAAHAYALLSFPWLTERRDTLRGRNDAILDEALDVALHDSLLIASKILRALAGHDAHQHGSRDDHPIQNDWNGSAKVALISLERSAAAWHVVAEATGDDTAAQFADQLTALRGEVEQAFPMARQFIRPGFDEPA